MQARFRKGKQALGFPAKRLPTDTRFVAGSSGDSCRNLDETTRDVSVCEILILLWPKPTIGQVSTRLHGGKIVQTSRLDAIGRLGLKFIHVTLLECQLDTYV